MSTENQFHVPFKGIACQYLSILLSYNLFIKSTFHQRNKNIEQIINTQKYACNSLFMGGLVLFFNIISRVYIPRKPNIYHLMPPDA